ncbi:hypothetical protein ADIARSV_0057 [Arcticibacter svalbardensis MN12-7]|uniref:Outer membrane protein n=1 Tax=Arcticibacter svalbardensis MN12-7 TaxID=1150600 RepID=R9H6J7_9SPHI|nr:RagB/SusD family nutrient uptake outer membrane protein [Arcticibacter svalbardensis]EOR96794.1 hypothetical protein ADIARSV_0057 [Arcticibacter svalbardensis MN12-7]
MKLIKSILVIFIGALLLPSCEKNFLDTDNPTSISANDIFSDPALVQLYVNNIYNDIPGWDFNTYINISDEARHDYPGSVPNTILVGNWNDTSNPMDIWTATYASIAKCNNFLATINTAPIDSAVKDKSIGEVRFLRAFFYFRLVQRYGGVPILDKPAAITDDLLVARNTSDECFDFIAKELDAAALLLPASADKGRATKGAALALKGRSMLYYSSPLFNTGNDQSRWALAAAANKAVMSLGKYSLYSDLTKLWQDPANTESVYEVQYHMPEKYHGLDAGVKPLILAHNDAGECSPLQELVDAFPMANGKPISDPTSGYDPNNPYVGRDNRFYADIAYNGSQIKGTISGVLTTITLQIYEGGRDFNEEPANQIYNTITGYYRLKAIDQNNLIYTYNYGSTQPWIEMRYAEVLLNYAEAENEVAGPDASVYDAINLLRKRAGITTTLSGGMSQDQMRALIHNERYIELCFEQQRYFDLRRWKQSSTRLNGNKFHGMDITKNANGTFSYASFVVDAQPLVFDEKMYLFPIPRTEIIKDKNLEQNPGWPTK